MHYCCTMSTTDETRPRTLRDRKRERTRAAIVDAGVELFQRVGYDETTIADIAAAADIGTRTFFGYFESKDELLFPESDARVTAVIRAIAVRRPDERPAEVLLNALTSVGETSHEIVGPTAELRLRLMESVPAVRGRALQVQRVTEREIADRLCEAYPGELSRPQAAALVGAFVGAITSVLAELLAYPGARADEDPASLFARLRRTIAEVLLPESLE